MPAKHLDMPHLLADLLHFLERPSIDQSGAPSLALEPQLQAGLAWLRGLDSEAAEPLADLIGCLITRLAQDRLAGRIALQSAQFELQTLRQNCASEDQDRLTGEARALGLILARLLPDLPDSLQTVAFSTSDYLALNPDVAEAGLDPLEHYLSSGAMEGRAPRRLATGSTQLGSSDAGKGLSAFAGSSESPRFCRDMPETLRDEALMLLGAKKPDVTVILPTWNRAHTVLSSIASALLQSYPPKEVIVIDDGSTDATVELLQQRFPEPLQEGRLVLITQANMGVSAARNAGLERAQGDFFAYLDSDNHWDSDHLLYALAGLLAVPHAQCAYTALSRHNLSHGWSDILFHPYDKSKLAETNYIDLNSFVHHRTLFDKLGGFDTGLTRLVDWDLIMRYTATGDPVALPVITGHHVVDSVSLNNITTSENLAPNLAYIRAKQSIT